MPVIDDFDDFQSAPPSAAISPAAKLSLSESQSRAAEKVSVANIFDVLGDSAPGTSARWSGPPIQPISTSASRAQISPSVRPSTTLSPASTIVPAPVLKSSGNFDDLWNLGLGTAASSSTQTGIGNAANNKSIKDLEREKSEAGMWGSMRPAPSNIGQNSGGQSLTSNADDLLL